MTTSSELENPVQTTHEGSVIRKFMPMEEHAGKRPLVLLHGIGSGSDHWGEFPRKLGRRVIAIDTRLNDSIQTNHKDKRITPSLADYALAVENIIDKIAKGEQVDILGLSLGGVLAQEIAIRDAKRQKAERRLGSLVLVATIPEYYKQQALAGAQRTMKRLGFHNTLSPDDAAILFGGDIAADTKLATLLGLTDKVDPVTLKQQHSALMNHIINRQIRAAFGMANFDNPIKSIKARTLVIGSDDDPMTPWANSEQIAQLIPDAELAPAVIGGGHLFALTRSDKIAATVNEFLDRDMAA